MKQKRPGGIIQLFHGKAAAKKIRAALCLMLIFALPFNLFLSSRFSFTPRENTNVPQQLNTFISSGDLPYSGEVFTRSLDKTVKTGTFSGVISSFNNCRQVKFRYFITISPGNLSKEVRTKTFLTSHFATDT
ncbi:MAG TPA: hypothetical protein VHO43_17855 [Ignavibacteriales bacterium]|nr:hypothetical protein [Ignavibacteriales bacterium]